MTIKDATDRAKEIELYDETVGVRQVFELLRSGYTKPEIANELGINIITVNRRINAAMADAAPAELVENFRNLSLLRVEHILKRVIPAIDKLDEGVVDKGLIKTFIDLVKLENTIVNGDKTGKSSDGGTFIQNNTFYEQTITSGSDMYERMLQEAKDEMAGFQYIEGHFDEDMDFPKDSHLDKLESLVIEQTGTPEEKRLKRIEDRFREKYGEEDDDTADGGEGD
jgi:hypothetical protein